MKYQSLYTPVNTYRFLYIFVPTLTEQIQNLIVVFYTARKIPPSFESLLFFELKETTIAR